MWESQCVGGAGWAGFGAGVTVWVGCSMGELGSEVVAVGGGCRVVVAVWGGSGVG